jgi:hypothetical protein
VTPTATPTPIPTVAPPTLLEPEDEAPFSGEKEFIKLAWTSSHTLKPDEFYELALHWTENGAPARNEVYLQETSWFVDEQLYLRADQETERIYYWSLRLVRKELDAEGKEEYLPFSPSSEERSFYWK